MNFQRFTKQRMKAELPPKRDIIAMCLAEFFGSLFLIFFGCCSYIRKQPPEEPDLSNFPNWFYVSFGYGSTVMALITIFQHISYAHFNPCVTVGAIIASKMPILLGPLYIVLQFIGSIVGYALLKTIIPKPYFIEEACVTTLGLETQIYQGFLIEFFATTILILAYCGVWDHRNEMNSAVPLKMGLIHAVLIIIFGIETQCGMNPARSFAAAIFNNIWTDHWIYWIGPFLGSIIATVFYVLVFDRPKPKLILKQSHLDTNEVSMSQMSNRRRGY